MKHTSLILLSCQDLTIEAEILAALAFPSIRTESAASARKDIGLVIAWGRVPLQRIAALHPPVLAIVDSSEQGVEALESGADDYMVRPLHARELNARVTAILRRAEAVFQFGDVVVDFVRGTVFAGDEEINVSNKELQLLRYLVSSNGRTVTRDELLLNVWRYRTNETRTVDFHVASLRKKLHPAQLIETVPRQGYRFLTQKEL